MFNLRDPKYRWYTSPLVGKVAYNKIIHYSYLALVAAMCCEADFVFIPEWPPEQDWPNKLCKKLMQVCIL